MKTRWLFLLTLLCLTAAAQADPITFIVSGGEGNLIQFQSRAPLETVTGTTNRVSGTITLDPADLTSGISAVIVVDAASIKTGNGIRDSHMRDNHLETKQYPEIRFTLDTLALPGSLAPGAPQKFMALGEFFLHGVTRTISVPVEVTYSDTGAQKRLRITGSFAVGLSEYNIPRPQFLIMRLDEIQQITVDFWGSAK